MLRHHHKCFPNCSCQEEELLPARVCCLWLNSALLLLHNECPMMIPNLLFLISPPGPDSPFTGKLRCEQARRSGGCCDMTPRPQRRPSCYCFIDRRLSGIRKGSGLCDVCHCRATVLFYFWRLFLQRFGAHGFCPRMCVDRICFRMCLPGVCKLRSSSGSNQATGFLFPAVLSVPLAQQKSDPTMGDQKENRNVVIRNGYLFLHV